MQLIACSPERPPKITATRCRRGGSSAVGALLRFDSMAGESTPKVSDWALPVTTPGGPTDDEPTQDEQDQPFDDEPTLSAATLTVTAGRPRAERNQPLSVPVVMASTFVSADEQ